MPSDSILKKWLEEGLDHTEIQQRISDEFHEDVALSSVSGHMSRIGATNRIKYSDWIPWARISLDHNHHYTLNMLRIGARIDRGLDVRDIDKRRFDGVEVFEELFAALFSGFREGFHVQNAGRSADSLQDKATILVDCGVVRQNGID